MDATNFSWLAMGQPTHVFDLDKLSGGIVVRLARAGEKLHLLDGTERTLTADDLVVADEKQAQGLAGVMGGWDSRVTEATKNILVEAAWFDPAAVRASSRRHGLHTDASHRFERGADFNAAPLGNHLVTRLVVEQSGGEVTGRSPMSSSPSSPRRTANRPPSRCASARSSATSAPRSTARRSAKNSSRSISARSAARSLHPATGLYSVQLPSWRLDLEREIDLIEEVARVYGYNKFADTLPSFAGVGRGAAARRAGAPLRETLLALGYSEAVSSTFVAEEEAATFSAATRRRHGQPTQRGGRHAAPRAHSRHGHHARRKSASRCERRAPLRTRHRLHRLRR